MGATANIPKGYKQTEVGVIPDDWDIFQFGDVSTMKGRIGWQGLKEEEFTMNTSQPFLITGMNFKDGEIRWNEVYHVSHDRYNVAKDIQLKKDDVLMTKDGTIGKILYVSDIPYPRLATLNSHLLVFRPIRSSYYPKYLYYILLSKHFKAFIDENKSGSTFFGISQNAVSRYHLILPPYREQEAIAESLSDTDASLESLEQLIAKKRDFKQGTMQELLTGKKRLPGFSGEWASKSIFELADQKKALFDDGDWIEAEHISEAGVRLIQTGNIDIGSFNNQVSRKYIFEESFQRLNCKEIHAGDLLVCRLAHPAGRACVLPDIGEEKIITSVDVTIFRPPPSLANPVFLQYVFSTNEWLNMVSNNSGGTTHKRIARSTLGKLVIKIPSIEEQEAIANVLSDMDTEISALEQRRDKLMDLKQGMMQQLLTGRIRLVEAKT